MRLSFDQKIGSAFVVSVVLMALLGYFSLRGIDRLSETARWVEHTQAVIDRLQGLLTQIEQASTGVRGFLITRDPDNLRAFHEIKNTADSQIRSLQDLTADNPPRRAELSSLLDQMNRHFTLLAALEKSVEAEQPLPVIEGELQQSNLLLGQIEASVTDIQENERSLLKQRYAAADASSRRGKGVIALGSFFEIIILMVTLVFLNREMTKGRRLRAKLRDETLHLQSINKELEAFSYSVSHDLRAPLRHIHGFVGLLQKSPAIQNEKSSRDRLEIVATAAQQMGVLIDDLLALSRTGRVEMHPSRINLREMVDHVIRELSLETEGRRVTWDIAPLPFVTGDPALLRLVWTNLLSNAVKFTRSREEARIRISHTVQKSPDSGDLEFVLEVRDNGVGFDPQYASKLFGVFQRLHRAEDFEGTGIGLANVQRIVHRHGGRVWAESQVDSGAVFNFSLPVEQPKKSHA